jgi:diamine N-acetyltransferase
MGGKERENMLVRENIIIRNVEREDLPTIKGWYSPEGRGEYMDFHFKSMETLIAQYQKDGFDSDQAKMLMITTMEGERLGMFALYFIREGLVNIGLGLCNTKVQNSGYGTLATRMIVEYLFANYPLARIEAETDAENISAQKVLDHVGFTREGVLRNFRYHHGQWRDFMIYSILPSEWKTA